MLRIYVVRDMEEKSYAILAGRSSSPRASFIDHKVAKVRRPALEVSFDLINTV